MSNPSIERVSKLGFLESEQALHDAAIEAVGFDDFGDPSYREGLRILLDAYDREAKFKPLGRKLARDAILDILMKRLRAEKMWQDDPSVLDHAIRRPIVILGLVRTGSTALHYLMGQDPGLQVLEYWLASHPQPRPPRDRWQSHPDFQYSVAELDAMYAADPSLRAIHFMMADGPEECRHLLAQNFTDDAFEVNATVPSFSEWYQGADLTETYLRHQRLIQLIGSTDTERRWLLKYPVHMRNLGTLLDVYPDACIIQTHRDPAKVFLSYCSLMAGFRAIYEDDIDPKAMTERQLELWAAGAESAIECRRQRDPAQFYDLHFKDFVEDPIGSVKRIYAHFGQELSPEGEQRLAAWQRDNPQHKHGRHEYSDDMGISQKRILDRFAAYMDHFQMKPE